ncbi:MAG: heavy metal translocating P-type ATPase [Henriciella sp.]|nr:heavy metal translocating P-type ATPase [Henriciella sp.]
MKRKGDLNTLTLSISGAKCGGCLSKIENALNALPGMVIARLNLSSGKLEAQWRGELSPETVSTTISNLGYGVSGYSEDAAASKTKSEERSLLIALGVAGFAAANIMLLSVSIWAGHGEMGETTRRTMHLLSGLIALPVLVFSGQHFFKSAFGALRNGHANMDVPISLALILAFSVSVFETLNGGEHAYFDAVVMLLFFLLIGRFLDARLRRQAYAAAHDLAALRGRSVNRINADGQTEAVRADDIKEGDHILLAAGERAVIDVKVLSGMSTIDESLVTGESLPRTINAGQKLYAGTVNIDQPIQGIALGAASDSLLSDISDMLEAGEQKRSAYRKIADKAVSLYVPFVHTTAALTFIAWLYLGANVREATMVAVTTLIITCPCALALAAPVAQVVASGRLFKKGVFLRSGDALERLAEIDHVVFDKTGTLTLGMPVLISEDMAELQIAAQLARASHHPLSRAIAAAAGPGPVAQSVTEHPGLGLESEIEGIVYRLGSAEWVESSGTPVTTGPALWFCRLGEAPVLFEFEDQVRSDASQTVRALSALGIESEILSGDRAGAVERAARTLSISAWTAGVSPAQKAERLEALTKAGKKPLMIGDGLNDAGALSLAHASLAPGGAIDVSQSASDAVFSGGLESILTILKVSKSAKRTMLQNFGLAAGYNLIAVPIAVCGLVTPLIAAIAMSASSLIVTLNALRIRG